MAITGMTILISDLLMLFVSSMLYQRGTLGFDGVLISTVALMSSFGPVTALANLGSTLQNTFAAGNRVLDIPGRRADGKGDQRPERNRISRGKGRACDLFLWTGDYSQRCFRRY